MRLVVHPEDPQLRNIRSAVESLRQGAAIAVATDTAYSFAGSLMEKHAIDKIIRLKGASSKKPLAILCADLADISRYAQVTDYAYRTMRRLLPGPFTFILEATPEVPRIMHDGSRKTIGLRVPDSPICQALIHELGCPLVVSTIQPAGDHSMNDPEEIDRTFGHQLAMVLDSGPLPHRPSTVVSLINDSPDIIREGAGPTEIFKK